MSHAVPASGVDNAWLTLLGACLCTFCGLGGVVYFTYGLFVSPIVTDTGWSATGVVAAMGPAVLFGGLLQPLIGRMSDRFGSRRLVLLGGPAFAIAMACLGLFSTSLTMFTALAVLVYALAFAGTVVPHARLLTGWFVKRRGLALSLMLSAAALGTAAWSPFAAFLIAKVGWRMAYVIIGSAAGSVIFLSGLFLMKDSPALATTDAGSSNEPGIAVAEALRSGLFWKISFIFTIVSAVFGGTSAQFPVLLRQIEVDNGTAVAAMSIIGIAMFLSRVILGLVIDRLFVSHATIGIILIGSFAFALLSLGTSQPLVFGAAFFVGFGLGAEYAVVAYIVSQAFGLRAYGAIYGLITLVTTLGMAGGPALIGVLLVTGVAPTFLFLGLVALLALAVVLLLTLRRSHFGFAVPAAR